MCISGDQIQDLLPANRVLYHWATSPALLTFFSNATLNIVKMELGSDGETF
jgi:hypothetical protein